MRRVWLTVLALCLCALTAAGCGGDDEQSGDGPVEITFWHGQTEGVADLLKEMITDFNKTHPNIKVSQDDGGVNADRMVQKVTAGLQAGSVPDIAYIYGSDLANLAKTDKLLDLDAAVEDGDVAWDQFYPAAQEAGKVDGRVRAVPALIDNLAVVYNKRIFDEAGVPYPKAGWSWDDFRRTAAELSDPEKGIVGFAWPGTGDEDTTWRIWPMIWQQGGEILAEDGESVAFDGPEGQAALEWVQSAVGDDSIYIDNTAGSERMQQLFASGKMAMNIAGPWALPEYVDADVDYGVAPLPTFGGEHTTIAGPDTWAIFDNGEARSKAAIEFVDWLTAPKQQLRWLGESGSLPTRKDVAEHPGFEEFEAGLPGLNVFVDNLELARTRPTVPEYPAISQAMGKAIANVLQGEKEPADALKQAAEAANAELGVPGN